MKRVLELCGHFNIEAGICINKYDINPEISGEIMDFAEENNIEVMGKVQFDPEVTGAQVAGKTCVEYIQNDTVTQIAQVWQKVRARLKNIKSQS